MNKTDIQGLKKHRHIIAAMIDTSIGYFTPLMALYALKAHKEKIDFCCEWYMDMVMKRHRGMDNKSIPEDAYREVNHDVIKKSFQRRHVARKQYLVRLAIVDRHAGVSGLQAYLELSKTSSEELWRSVRIPLRL